MNFIFKELDQLNEIWLRKKSEFYPKQDILEHCKLPLFIHFFKSSNQNGFRWLPGLKVKVDVYEWGLPLPTQF